MSDLDGNQIVGFLTHRLTYFPDAAKAINQRERWEQHHREKRKAPGRARSVSPGRSRRSVSTERYVETLVVVDPKMVEYHASEHLETYVLTIMNMVINI